MVSSRRGILAVTQLHHNNFGSTIKNNDQKRTHIMVIGKFNTKNYRKNFNLIEFKRFHRNTIDSKRITGHFERYFLTSK